MLHAFIMLAAFVVVTACAAVAFVIWLVTNIVSMIQRLIAGPPPHAGHQPVQGGRLCVVPNCQSINPSDANFCRRCGRAFASPVMMLPQPRRMMRRRHRMHRLEMLREML